MPFVKAGGNLALLACRALRRGHKWQQLNHGVVGVAIHLALAALDALVGCWALFGHALSRVGRAVPSDRRSGLQSACNVRAR
jgi:hypothetical protein